MSSGSIELPFVFNAPDIGRSGGVIEKLDARQLVFRTLSTLVPGTEIEAFIKEGGEEPVVIVGPVESVSVDGNQRRYRMTFEDRAPKRREAHQVVQNLQRARAKERAPEERRVFKRVTVALSIDLVIGNLKYTLSAIDLSEGGVLCEGDIECRVGEQAIAVIQLGDERLVLRGRVVSREHNLNRLRIAFYGMDERAHEIVRAYIRDQR
jgi:hypothetical protein